jgi:hypothetical protein
MEKKEYRRFHRQGHDSGYQNRNKALILFALTVAMMLPASAQQVFVSKYKSEADIKVFVTKYKSEANLVVFVAEYKSEAKGIRGIWFYTKYKSDADWKVWFAKYKSEADIVVFFTKYKAEAGWRQK